VTWAEVRAALFESLARMVFYRFERLVVD